MSVEEDITHEHDQEQEWNHNRYSLIIKESKEEYNHSFDASLSFSGSSAQHVSIKPVRDGTSLSLWILGNGLLAWI